MKARELGIIGGGVIWCGLFPALAERAMGLLSGTGWSVNVVFGAGGILGFLLFAGVSSWIGTLLGGKTH